jgi:hypothetical protein
MQESWLPVEGYEDLYEVSDQGRVRSLTVRVANGAGTRVRNGRVLKQNLTPQGYLTVMLSRDSAQVRVLVSRLVAAAFKGLLPAQEADHRDGNRRNNTAGNLRPATSGQNHMNTGTPRHNTSGYKGVSWHKARGKWRATLGSKHLGHFDDPAEGHLMYLVAAVSAHGDFVRTA